MENKKKYEAQDRYDAKNTQHYGLKFNRNTDADIIAALDQAESKQGFVKDAIRFYLSKNSEKKER